MTFHVQGTMHDGAGPFTLTWTNGGLTGDPAAQMRVEGMVSRGDLVWLAGLWHGQATIAEARGAFATLLQAFDADPNVLGEVPDFGDLPDGAIP